jgi:Fur family peroxide stress response transcriptional regulator
VPLVDRSLVLKDALPIKQDAINEFRSRLERSLDTSGFRFTRQRQEVFEVVAESHDHPTADEIFDRAKRRMPEISFATVYNCLSVLVECGLVRQVTLDRSPTRFCPNMRDHCHFFCDECGRVTDIDLPSHEALKEVPLPGGFAISSFDISLRGKCPHCSGGRPERNKALHGKSLR